MKRLCIAGVVLFSILALHAGELPDYQGFLIKEFDSLLKSNVEKNNIGNPNAEVSHNIEIAALALHIWKVTGDEKYLKMGHLHPHRSRFHAALPECQADRDFHISPLTSQRK